MRAAGRARRRWPRVDATQIASALTALVGHPVQLEVRRVGVARKPDLGARGPVIVLDSAAPIAVEVEAEIALAIVGALAGARIPRVSMGRKVEPEVAGALAGIVQHLAREYAADCQIASELAFDDALVIDATVRLGTLRGHARVAISLPELDAAPAMTPSEVLFSLGETPLSLPVVVAAGLARAADLANLGLGDVVVVEGFRGAALVAPEAAAGVRVTRLVLDGEEKIRVEADRAELAAATPPADEAHAMSDDGATLQLPALEESGHLAEHLAELPLAVRIEAGSATLSAREWAALAVGDVLVLDRRVGDPVTLRIGGKALARGELVEVDGALAVRITERTP
ncbi:MAG: FliM/FliN family flagellar motor switch protein [Polyangiales bacterium]